MINVWGAFGLALALTVQSDSASERIYGVVRTTAGEHLEGYVRWGRRTHWADFLDGRKEILRDHASEAERLDPEFRARRQLERSITLPTVRITWEEDDGVPPETTPFSSRFANILSMERVGTDRSARVDFVSGEPLELAGVGVDLVIEDERLGEVDLDWLDVARADFRSAPPGRAPPRSVRLHGIVRTRSGAEFTGWVAWDLDESVTSDVLDGRRGRSRVEIPFADIVAIERVNGASARITLANGEQMVLRGSNDVGDDNRGIEITDTTLGRVVVGWENFMSLRLFWRDAAHGTRDALTRSGRLRGTVASSDGRRASGDLRWDNSQQHAWETIRARSEGVDLTIELGSVLSIARAAAGARVVLTGGRAFAVEEGGSFAGDNRGVFTESGVAETVMVPWRHLLTLTFER